MSVPLPSSIIPDVSKIKNFVRQYLDQATQEADGFPEGVSVLGRELLRSALSGINASIDVIPGQFGALGKVEKTDKQYYRQLTNDETKILKPLVELFGQFLNEATAGALSAIFKPNSVKNHTVNCFAFKNPGLPEIDYVGILFTGIVPAVTAFDEDIFLEQYSTSTILHELFHIFQNQHPVELPVFDKAPDFLKFLMADRNKRFSYLLDYYESPQSLPKFSDNALNALANWLDARTIDGTMLGPDWPILDKSLLRYRLAATPQNKSLVINQTSDELMELMRQSADILFANNATAVPSPTPSQNSNPPLLSNAAASKKQELGLINATVSQFGNGFVQGFTATTWNAFVHARAGLTPSQTWLLQHLAGPVFMASMEFVCLSPFKNSTRLDVHFAIALGPRLLEALSVGLLGRCIPGLLPELRQFHGYLGLFLMVKHLASQNFAVGLSSLAAGFVGGHLGKVLAHATVHSCQKWVPTWFGPLGGPPEVQSEPSPANTTPLPTLSGPSLWLHRLETNASKLDHFLAGVVKQAWGLDFLYRRYGYHLPANSSPAELPA